ncbi:MAG: tetratricopeptide (TPR) repeat protein [Planctomycetota bacterium]|jgi:tetratricopeptide (TPR) repeat protein
MRPCLSVLVIAPAMCLGGCFVASPGEGVETAEKAAELERWNRAADLWYDIHRKEREKTARPFTETARALFHSGDAESACGMILDGLNKFPYDSGLLELHAEILEDLGFRRAAEPYLVRLVKAHPEHVAGWVALGRVRVGLGNELEAEYPLTRALELAPGSVEPHVHLARVRQTQGDAPGAFDHYSRAIDLGREGLGFLLDAASISIDPVVLDERVDASERGLDWTGKALAMDPQSTCAHYLRGVHLELLGESDQARIAFLRAVETDPSCLVAIGRLAFLYSQAGDSLRTAEMVKRALDIERDEGRRNALEELLVPEPSTAGEVR